MARGISRFNLLVSGIIFILLLGTAGVAFAAQQTYNGDVIQMIVQDSGRPTINAKSSTGGGFVGQYYNYGSPTSVSWGSCMYLDNAGTWSSYGDGYTHGGFTPVSNVTNAIPGGTEIVTTADLASTGVRVVQRFTHKTGDRFVTKEWTFTNNGSTTFSGARFYHGGDTYFGGVDSARGYFDPTKSMVYIRNNDYTNWGIMGFYANPGTPATRYFEGNYSTGYNLQRNMTTLPDTVDSGYVDAGYQLEWDRASLAPGDSWTIQAYEIWTPGGALQMIAPGTQNAVPGSTVTLPFTVQNLGNTPMTLNLAASSTAGWTTSVEGGSPVTVPANTSMVVNIEVTIPDGASGAGTIDLNATGDATGSAAVTLNTVDLDLNVGPEDVDFGTVASGDATSQLVTVTNDSATPVTFGTVAAIAPFGTAADGISGQTLAPGASLTVLVTFSSGTGGSYSGSLNIPIVSPVLVTRTIPLSAEVASSHLVVFQTDGTFGATLTGVASQPVADGGDATPVTANAPLGHHFVNWTGTGGFAPTTDNPVTVEDVTQAMTLTSHFAIDTFTLAYHAGANGSISGTSPQSVDFGSSGTQVTAVPATGYHFVSWSDGYPTAARTDTNVSASVDATASFAINAYTLQYIAGAGGSISGTDPQTVNYGANGSQVTAVPSVGYHFGSWSDGVLTAARTDTTVTASLTTTASFVINTYTLAYHAGANGSISGTSPQSVTYGSSGTQVTALPATGYHFVSWSDGYPTAARTDSSVSASLDATASFAINTYTLKYASAGNGTISGTTPQTVDYGASGSQVTAVGNTGYHFVSWSDGGLTAARSETNVTASLTTTASFAINTYKLSYSAGANGTVSGVTSQTVTHGSAGSPVTAVGNTGYHFVSWSDGVMTATRTDSGVTYAMSPVANFAINMYALSYSAGPGGTISGSTAQSIAHGSNGSAVQAVPSRGYHFVSWSDGLLSVARTDNNITSDFGVRADFAINVYLLSYSAGQGGSIWGSPSQSIAYGNSGTQVVAIPSPGYHFVSWSDGVMTASRSDNLVGSDISVSASFAIDVHSLSYTAGSGGTISGAAQQNVVGGSGGTQVTAVPNPHYHFVSWSDGVTTASRTDLNVAADIDATARFAIDTFTLSYVAGTGGTVAGTSPQTVAYGADGTQVTATPSAGYRFAGWSDGVTSAIRKDTGITGSLSVTAAFEYDTNRFGGADRYSVAAGVAGALQSSWANVRHVLVVSGSDRAAADPITAGPLAGAYGAPVLLVREDRADLPADTAASLRAIAAANPGRIDVHLVGGPGSVPDALRAKILAVMPSAVIERIGGADRYEVAANVAARLKGVLAVGGHTIGAVLVSNGQSAAGMYGALALAPIGAHNGMPILLVKATSVPAATAKALASLGVASSARYVAGPGSLVSDAVLRGVGAPAGNRIADASDASRAGTAVAIADTALAKGWLAAGSVGLANKLPDAMTGGTLMGHLGGPLLYTEADVLSPSTAAFLAAHNGAVSSVQVFGGPASISQAVVDAAQAELH